MKDVTSQTLNEEYWKADAFDAVIEVYKRDLDFTLVERNLRLTTDERARQLVNGTRFIGKFRPLVTRGSAPSR
jgi:hypothetical protein